MGSPQNEEIIENQSVCNKAAWWPHNLFPTGKQVHLTWSQLARLSKEQFFFLGDQIWAHFPPHFACYDAYSCAGEK